MDGWISGVNRMIRLRNEGNRRD